MNVPDNTSPDHQLSHRKARSAVLRGEGAVLLKRLTSRSGTAGNAFAPWRNEVEGIAAA